MDKYFNTYREMISLHGLSTHTLKSYCTYIRAYLDYLTEILHKLPEDVSWTEFRQYILWLQASRNIADCTVNTAISLRHFFTLYVLHKPWDSTQLPIRKLDTYLPYVPTVKQVAQFLSTIPDLKVKVMVALMYSAGLFIGEVCHLRYEDIDRTNMRIHIVHTKGRSDRYAILSKTALNLLTEYWFAYSKPMGWLFPKQYKTSSNKPIDTFFFPAISMPMNKSSAGIKS